MIIPRSIPPAAERPVSLSAERRIAYLRAIAAMTWPPPREGFAGRHPYRELPLLELQHRGEAPTRALDWATLDTALGILRDRRDCQDFAMSGFVRMLYRHERSSLLGAEQWAAIRDAHVGAKYWYDEPGEDHACWGTENHQALYHSAEYLWGQHLPDAVFTNNGKLGCWHREHGRERLYRWLTWRSRLGFSEWNSACYSDEVLAPLLNVVDFADDAELRHRACCVLDTLCIHLALIAFQGVPGGSQGRAYSGEMLNPQASAMAAFGRLLFTDCPAQQIGFSIAAVALCASDYQPPLIARAIADDLATRPATEIRERHGADVEDAAAFGIRPDRVSDLGFFTGSGEGNHHLVVDAHYAHASGKGHWYGYHYYKERKRMGEPFDPDPHQHALTQADLYHYRTPQYMLSAAQDYRAGKAGYQQFIWCARLAADLQVFSTNPAPADVPYGRPGPWCGNGVLPRVLAHRNVAICLHRVEPCPIYDQPPWYKEDYVHLFFPRGRFDDWREANGWLFGRRGAACIAVTATTPGQWIDLAPNDAYAKVLKTDQPYEWRFTATHVAVVCELGAAPTPAAFDAFVAAISARRPEGDITFLTWDSPSLGPLTAGWEQPLTVVGTQIPVRNYPRFDCPYAQVPFGQEVMAFRLGDLRLDLDPDQPAGA